MGQDKSLSRLATMNVMKGRALLIVAIAWIGLIAPHKTYASEVLRLATDVWLPYENISNSEAPGFSTEMIVAVLSSLKIEPIIHEAPWARGLSDVFNGKVDALFSAFWTRERAHYCFYSDEPLMREKWVFFVRSDDVDRLSFTSYDQIRNRRIGILRGASVTEDFWIFLKENSNYEEVETDDLNFQKLSKRRLDYVVTSYSNGVILLKKLKLSDVIQPLSSPIIKEDNLYIIFSKKTVTREFVMRFSEALRDFKATQDYRALLEKYFEPLIP